MKKTPTKIAINISPVVIFLTDLKYEINVKIVELQSLLLLLLI